MWLYTWYALQILTHQSTVPTAFYIISATVGTHKNVYECSAIILYSRRHIIVVVKENTTSYFLKFQMRFNIVILFLATVTVTLYSISNYEHFRCVM